MRQAGWCVGAALAFLVACDNKPSPGPGGAGATSAAPRTLEQQIADFLAEGAILGEERVKLEAAAATKIWKEPHMQFLADFHVVLLKGASRAPEDAHAALVKEMAPAGSADRAIEEFARRHFSSCTTMRFVPGRGTFTACETGERTAQADPRAAAAAYVASVLPGVGRLAEIADRLKSFEKEFVPLIERHFGRKADELNEKEAMEKLLPLVEKHRPDAYEKLTALMGAAKAESVNEGQEHARQQLDEIHAGQIAHYVRDGDGNRVRDYWVADAGRLSRFGGEWKPEEPPARDGGSYVFAPVRLDGAGEPYGRDTDGSGNAWRNRERFAFCAYPREYPKRGRQTYLLDQTGTIWCQDTGGRGVERFPANPEAEGWTTAAKAPAERTIATELFRYGLEIGSDDVTREGLAALRARGDDTKMLLLTIMRQGAGAARRIAPLLAAELAGTEDATALEELAARCEETADGGELVAAMKTIGPKAWPAAYARLTDRLFADGDPRRAWTLYSTLRGTLTDEERTALAKRAAAATVGGQGDRLELWYELRLAAPMSDAECAAVYRARARWRLASGRRDEGIADLKTARGLAPPPDEEARAFEGTFPELAPPRSETHRRMTELLEKGEATEAAEVALAAADEPERHTVEDRRDFALVLASHGRKLLEANDFMADSTFGAALKLDDACAEAYLGRGLSGVKSRLIVTQVIDDIRAVMRLNRKLVEPHATAFAAEIARYARWLQDKEEQKELLKLAEDLHPRCAGVWLVRAGEFDAEMPQRVTAIEKALGFAREEKDAKARSEALVEIVSQAKWIRWEPAWKAERFMTAAFALFDGAPPKEALETRGEFRIGLGDAAGAEEDYRAAGKADWLAERYAKQSEAATDRHAKALLQGRAHAIRPERHAKAESFTVQEWVAYAEVSAKVWRRVEAAGAYAEAIRLEPGAAQWHWQRAQVVQDLGDLPSAERGLTRAIELDPKGVGPYAGRGQVRYDLGDEAGALADYDEVVKLAGADPGAYSMRGFLRLLCGRWKDAAADFSSCIEKSKERVPHIEVYRWVARTRAGDAAGAAEGLAAAFKEGGAQVPVVDVLLDKADEAGVLGREYGNADQRVTILYVLAEKRLSKGDRAGAAKYFRECLEAGPKKWPERFLRAQLEAVEK